MGRGRPPGTSQATILKPGFTVAQHQELGERLGAMKQQALGLRQVIRDHAGSATLEYQAVTRLVQAVQGLQTALLHLAVGEHVDRVPLDELRAIYANGEGA
jgi:hypothetical protein